MEQAFQRSLRDLSREIDDGLKAVKTSLDFMDYEGFLNRALSDPDWMISLLRELKKTRLQRDLAEATARRRREEAQKAENVTVRRWFSVQAIKWLPEYFDVTPAARLAITIRLRRICADKGVEARTQAGKSGAKTSELFPEEAVEEFKRRLDACPEMLRKYRK